MQPLRAYSVAPKLPAKLEGLWELAYNFWFAWNYAIEEIFVQIDQRIWLESYKNPVFFLNRVPQKTLETLANDELFLERLKEARNSLRHYLTKKNSPIVFPGVQNGKPVVAYFSLEYGLSLCLPIYSGGLGILAGDHLKSASDLNIPLVGVGLCYQQGYFRQYLTPDGWQQERYPIYDFEQTPIKLVKGKSGAPVIIDVDLGGQTLSAQIWEAAAGRVRLFLLDTNLAQNPPHFKQITSRLYGGGLEMRIWQEILLGVGGVKALRALDFEPKVIHMNEGHSAFAGLERIRFFMQEHGLSFEAAMEITASTSVFTTHTPVPAGNDRFPPDLMQRYFEGYARDMGLAFKVLLALGREDPRDDAEQFCMTVLALKLSRFNNGVSKLHGRVSRTMWRRVWPQYPMEDVPIGAITNGVHVASWVAPDMALLFDRYLGSNWREDPDCARVWSLAETMSEAELWRTHERLRARLVDYVRYRLHRQLQAKGVRRKALELSSEVLSPEALTIGFARRFATYKRANLLLQNKDRLLSILTNKSQPVQFIFAGKAHPQDNEGKKIIQEILQLCRTEECRYKMIFLEDYDMEIAQHLVQGCDVWLNTPRRPLEACGTSGMKAMVNGVLELSTLDGWWAEAYRPDNSVGWGVGQGEEYEDAGYQDFVESQTLFNMLENEVIPEFYDRGPGGLPRNWIRRMKLSLKELVPVFNSHRMVEDYARGAYLPAYENFNRLMTDGFQPARELSAWRMDMMTKWGQLKIRNIKAEQSLQVVVGESLAIEAEVHLNGIRPADVKVEIYAGPLDNEGSFAKRSTVAMKPVGAQKEGWQTFQGSVQPVEAGRFGFTVRIVPNHPLMLDPHSLGLIHWALPEA
jgi:starch phosphorylase